MHASGALIGDAAAYTLARALDRDEIVRRLEARGFKERWIEEALAALDAIDFEAARWHRAAIEHVNASGSASGGTGAVPQPTGASSSVGMKSTSGSVTVKDAAVELGVSDSYVRRLARGGVLPAVRSGRGYSLDAAAVADYARQRSTEAA